MNKQPCHVPGCHCKSDVCSLSRSTQASYDQWKQALEQHFSNKDIQLKVIYICKCHFKLDQFNGDKLRETKLDFGPSVMVPQIELTAAQAKIEDLEKQLQSKTSEFDKMTEALSKYLEPDQLKSLFQKQPSAWSDRTLMKAVSVYSKVSVTAYDYIRETIAPLPSSRTIRRHIGQIETLPGVQENVLSAIPKTAKTRYGALLLDETVIKDKLVIDKTFNTIAGTTSPEFGGHSIATHVLAYVLKDIQNGKKFVAAYYLTANSVTSADIRRVTLEVIDAIEAMTEFRVQVLLSDMGPSNLKLWNELGVKHSKDNVETSVDIEGRTSPLIVMPDISHLIKNFRNYFVSKNDAIEFQPDAMTILRGRNKKSFSNKISVETFDAIVDLQHSNPGSYDRSLTRKTVHPEHYAKMKVSHAERLLSSKAIDDITKFVSRDNVSEELKSKSLALAAFIDHFSMFYRLAVSRDDTTKRNSAKYALLMRLLGNIDTLFKNMITEDRKWKPWMTGFLMYTNGIRNIFNTLGGVEEDIAICVGLLSTDAIESLFSQLKSKNPHPTADEVKLALKRLVASNMCEAKLRGNVASTDHENELNIKDLQSYSVTEHDIPFMFIDDPHEFFEDLDVYQNVSQIQSALLASYKCSTCSDFYSMPSGPTEIAGHQPSLSCFWPIFGVCGLLENCFRLNEPFLQLHSKNSLSQFMLKFFLFIDISEYEISIGAPNCHCSVRDIVFSYFQMRIRKFIQFKSQKITKTHASLAGARVTQIKD